MLADRGTLQEAGGVVADEARVGEYRDRIEHVVVLMLENRSFDHLLGFLDHPDPAYPRLDELNRSCPVDPARPDGRRVATTASARAVLGNDPDHSHQAAMLQMFGREGTPGVGTPTMSGFIESYRRQIEEGPARPLTWWERLGSKVLFWVRRWWNRLRRRPQPILAKPDEIMKCFPDREIPVLGSLAKRFAVLTDWHASVPGETWPNRQFAHAATSHGTANIEYDFYDDVTVFERLSEAGRDWAVYQDGVAQVWVYPRLWLEGTERFHGMERFFRDVAAGTLPAYSFVEPDHGYGAGEGNSQHPGNNTSKGDSFLAGERLMADIYHALLDNPTLFATTLFLVTYDEHGGFFDHCPPHEVAPPDGHVGRSGFDFSLSGVRVPAVAVSPLIPAGTVDGTFYDHATIPATVRRQFAAGSRPLTRRDAAANDLLDHLPLLPTARTDLQPIHLEPPAAAPRRDDGKRLNDFQASLVELAGAVRRAREPRTAAEAAPRAATAEAVPEFRPEPATHAAAEQRRLPPGSAADRAVDDVVADFVAE
jgi:phospholipase C